MAIEHNPAATTLEPGPGPAPTSAKAALRRCCTAWQRAFNASMEDAPGGGSELDEVFAAKDAAVAYCNAMPLLATHEGVRDFVACAAHGILIGAIPPEKSSRLFQAAQVALATLRLQPKSPKSTK